MKSSITYKLAVLLVIPVIYFFLISGFNHSVSLMTGSSEVTVSPPSIQYDEKDFTNCIFNSEFNEIKLSSEFYVENNVSYYWDSLHFNAVNWYDFKGDSVYGIPGVNLNQDQIDDYKSVLNAVATKPLKGFYEKCNFSYPMYGQRLVYEVYADNESYADINYGFSYRNCMQEVYTTDQSRTVLHAVPQTNQEGYLCNEINENFQHTDLFDFRQNDQGFWYIKPVMKIPTGTAPDDKVVTIDVISFNNRVIKQIVLRGMNFNVGGSYNGQYTDKYIFGGLNDSLQILGDAGTDHLNHGRTDDFNNWPSTCKVDFRVYWHGGVEVWFDKLVVDDGIANELFSHLYDAHILQDTTPENFLYAIELVKNKEFTISNMLAVDYVITLMHNKLKNQAISISLQ